MHSRVRVMIFLLFVTIAIPAAAATPRRLIVFQTGGFPTIDGPAIDAAVLDEALRETGAETIADLRDLRTDAHATLVLPYGSAFPLEAWPQIRDFVHAGGSLVVLGGAPFHQPMLREKDGAWIAGVRQPAFAHEFLIGPAEGVKTAGLRSAVADPSWKVRVDGGTTAWELTVRLASSPEIATESGSEGRREGIVRPLVHLVDNNGIPRACPLVEIDRYGSGARWIFATSDAPLAAAAIRAIVERAREDFVPISARPLLASVDAGAVPSILVTAPGKTSLVVRDVNGNEVHRASLQGNATAEIRTRRALRPGLYRVTVESDSEAVTTGFWVKDQELIKKGPRLTVSRDWIRKNGKVFPVIGTTYMASDVHRQFLFEPNPALWDRDFEQMSRLGINFVRTGLWTGWARAAGEHGSVDESVLRALEAYVQSAARHDIVVCFTFFAFQPPTFGGTNPFVDARALEGQREFVTSVAKRFRGVGWIHYDLINEPSYAPADKLWTNQPIGDATERAAWDSWVRVRHGEDVSLLRDLWQDPSNDVFALPAAWEIWPAQVREGRRPRKVFDFVLFSQDAVTRWAAMLRGAIREAGGDPLVTLGQDEGGTGTRSSQQLHAPAVDYTSTHPWWQNDDVLPNGVFAKTPEKPMLLQETGLMRLEDVNGFPWRSPELAASLLERKYASAFAARGAGVVEWAWNINPYMPIDNESVIGFWRPDGTAKPELDVVQRYAKFFAAAAPWLDDFAPDPVVIVIPQSRLFMNRPAALDGFRRAVRLLSERFGIVPTAISDLTLTSEKLRGARLVLVPSAEFLPAGAADALGAAAENGTRILFTGAVTGDQYGRIPGSLRRLGVVDSGRPVQYRESTGNGFATFDRNLHESLLRGSGSFIEQGNIIHQPLPLEFAREDEPLRDLLASMLAAAGVTTHAADGLTLRILDAPRATLIIAINDTSLDAVRRVKIDGRDQEISVAAGRSALLLVDRTTGKLLATD